uniref:DDE Tnp4 domain-containing protein n=1 Tax=Chenopodium quinoa TaxID=63459 RepID=A0A803MX90_CHEQI
MKGKYIAWYELKTGAGWTGLAFDAVTGCPLIKQDDRWAAFVKKHKGRPIQFLKRPLANEDLLHAYFKGTFATNKLAISPSMAKNASLFSDYEDQEPTGDNDDEQDDSLNLTPEDNNVDHENYSSRISPPLGKRKSLGETSKINKKRMSDIDKCIELVKSTIQAESSKVQSNPVQEKFNLLAATLKEIPQMKDYNDSFYIHVLEYITKDHNGEFFMALTTNHQKLLWLKSRDGTHISAVVSDGDGQPFRGRKGTKTWNVLASCSFNRLFTFVNVGYQGSAHDITVWRNCLTDPKFEFPHPPLGKYYLVDSGYPNTLGYLSPIKDKQTRYHMPEFHNGPPPRGMLEHYNYRQSSLRTTIERLLVRLDGYYNGAIKTRKMVQPMDESRTAEEACLQRSQQLKELYESLSAGESNNLQDGHVQRCRRRT